VSKINQPSAIYVAMTDFDVHVLGGADVAAGRGLGEGGREQRRMGGRERETIINFGADKNRSLSFPAFPPPTRFFSFLPLGRAHSRTPRRGCCTACLDS